MTFAALMVSGQRTPWKRERRSPPAPTKMHAADRIGGEHARPGGFLNGGEQRGQLLDPTAELIDVVLHGQDAADALEVDALILGEPLDQSEPCNIAG